jgi:hypothetical protein
MRAIQFSSRTNWIARIKRAMTKTETKKGAGISGAPFLCPLLRQAQHEDIACILTLSKGED